jgi:predicted nucleotidyltransferase
MATIRLTPEFKEFLKLLNSEKIEYLLIGGYAVGLYGFIRGTKDIDVWVAVEPENLERLVGALVKFGFSRASLSPEMFTQTQKVFRMGVPPNMIEILTKISAVEFRECYARRTEIALDGIPVPVIAYEDLKKNKLSTGRPRDQGDIQAIEKFRQRKA